MINPLKNVKVGNRLILLLILLSGFQTFGQAGYLAYPDYVEVVNRFFKKYSVKDLPDQQQLHFEKRPDGWHVTIRDYISNQVPVKDELFWERKKEKFRKIAFDKINDPDSNTTQLEQFRNDWSRLNYRVCPYFGYPGWDLDVIKDYGEVTGLADSTLYGLGRAYSSYASNLLNDNTGFADKSKQFFLPPGKNCMTPSQLEEYRYYQHRAISAFRKVDSLNPKYETIVGAIGIKASNEYITSFLNLRIYQNEDEANKELTGGLYNDFHIAMAKNYLQTCAPNTILLTNGDNDTYPLLYVQSYYGFRKDVLVVNFSLLNNERYINSLREQILDAPPMPMTFTPDEISGRKRDAVIIETNKDAESEPMELTRVISYLKNDTHQKLYGDINYFYIPTNRFMLHEKDTSIQWETDQQYFFRSQLMVLDMLAVNQWKRPVYFAVTLASDAYFGMTDYFQQEGLAYRLVSTKKQEDDGQTGTVSEEIMYHNLMYSYDWSGMQRVISHEKNVCMNYRNMFHRLAERLTKVELRDSAEAVLDKCIVLMPDEVVRYDVMMIPIIEDYYLINEFDKGNTIAKRLISNIRNYIDNYSDVTIVIKENHKEEYLAYLRELALKYGQDEIVKEIDK